MRYSTTSCNLMADEKDERKVSKPGPSTTPGEAAPQSGEVIPGVLLPPLPKTDSPVEFKQQINVYQIPQNAWDRLNQEQTVQLTKMILERADAMDKRHFEYAMEKSKQNQAGKQRAMILGTLITIAGYAASGLLAAYGHEMASVSIALPLTTILAMVIGNRFLE